MQTNVEQPPRILERQEVERIVARIRASVRGGGDTDIAIWSWWNGELRWARNRTNIACDRRDVRVHVTRYLQASTGFMETNQVDDSSLESLVRATERSAMLTPHMRPTEMAIEPAPLTSPTTKIWSDSTYNVTAEQRGGLMRVLTRDAEQQGMLSAGYLEMRGGELASFSSRAGDAPKDTIQYNTYTQAQCSMTVRHPKGVGSGWAGLSSYDWSAIDGEVLAKRALDKCLTSLNPVAIEPGRYTVILEPQAVCDLIQSLQYQLGGNSFARLAPEEGRGAFFLGPDPSVNMFRSKLGLKVVDERITIDHDPQHPQFGILPAPGLAPVTWIRNGILTSLSYLRPYAIAKLGEDMPALARGSFRMSGGTTSVDEMIAGTKRGLLVTRFSDLETIDLNSILLTGSTRDGLWLIENGKITKTVKNLRVTESPLFALNQVEQLGIPVPVFHPVKDPYVPMLTPVIVPPLKVNDFSFTSMIDAV